MLDLKQLETAVQYGTNPSGERVAVIVSIEEFKELLEDLQDSATIVNRRDEPTVSHDEVLDEFAD
jgi:hypothetical protein